MGLSTTHLLIFLLIVVVIFGTKKLRNIGSDLGSAVRNFKEGLRGEEAAPSAPAASPAPAQPVIDVDVEVKEKP